MIAKPWFRKQDQSDFDQVSLADLVDRDIVARIEVRNKPVLGDFLDVRNEKIRLFLKLGCRHRMHRTSVYGHYAPVEVYKCENCGYSFLSVI